MKKRIWLLILASIVLMTGCNSPKKISYWLDMAYDTKYPVKPAPELVLQKGDRLEVLVYNNLPPELKEPLQPWSVSGETVATDQFTIDRDGFIEYPRLGLIPLEGKTLKEAKETISGLFKSKGYIKDPSVSVKLVNFTITVLGYGGNSLVPVESESINLLQLIALSGGISENNNIREVTVLRTENDVQTAYKVNLQSRDMFDSPVFYLQQHDVVYIKPMGGRLSATGQSVMTFVTAGLSVAIIVTNLLLWYSRK